MCSGKLVNKKLLGVCCGFFLAGTVWAQNDGNSSKSIRVVSEPGYEYSERIINSGESFTDQDEAEAGTDLLDEDDQPVSGMNIILIKKAIDLAAARDVGADFSGVDASFQ
jgi:hypothetical protein